MTWEHIALCAVCCVMCGIAHLLQLLLLRVRQVADASVQHPVLKRDGDDGGEEPNRSANSFIRGVQKPHGRTCDGGQRRRADGSALEHLLDDVASSASSSGFCPNHCSRGRRC